MSLLRRRMMMQKERKQDVNLIDKSTLIYGLLDMASGGIFNRTDWMTTDYIAIDGTDNYELEGFKRLRYIVMDAEKNIIKTFSSDNFFVTHLVGGSYIRFTFPTTDAETITFKHI